MVCFGVHVVGLIQFLDICIERERGRERIFYL